MRESESNNRRISRIVVWALLCAGFALLILAGWLYMRAPHKPEVAGASEAAPSSVRPNQQAIDNYQVAADLPKYISIPAAQITKARIVQLGLTKNNVIAAPSNIYDTGWYNTSAKPGQPGAMFIYGHVSSWTANGVFYDLKKLRRGDKITITRGDNKQFTYQVASSKVYSYDKVDMAQVLAPANPDQPGLNLMTCTGQIIKGTSEFTERLVVFTNLIS
jgi:LPXTG-site transpeptidase (sortase) family protein